MQQTPARSKFKERFGQANHFLITNLVALHHLDESSVISAPTELRTSWNPKDRKASIRRTREFTLEAFLGSAVDGIDMYLTLLYRKPNYIQDRALESVMDGTNHSVARKVSAFASHYDIEAIPLALVDVLITWRNNVIHALAENELQESTEKTLRNLGKEIAEGYRGLDPAALPSKAIRGEALTFKETASLIRATHNFVELVDKAVLARRCGGTMQASYSGCTRLQRVPSFRTKVLFFAADVREAAVRHKLVDESIWHSTGGHWRGDSGRLRVPSKDCGGVSAVRPAQSSSSRHKGLAARRPC
jgi:hypothetical protein